MFSPPPEDKEGFFRTEHFDQDIFHEVPTDDKEMFIANEESKVEQKHT